MDSDASAAASSHGASSLSSDRPSSSHAGHHTANSGSSSYSAGNPYMSKNMYSSSFMSTEGSQSIQSLIGVQTREELGRSSSSSHSYPQVILESFLARDSIYAIARYMPSPVRPSIRLSVTRVDQSKTFEVRITQPSPQSSPMTLVS